ncbi:MAG: hypothetical protein PWP73_1158 [Methanococcus sp.]|nr:hypothetical protein [Methanococcus sp.]
MDEKHLPKKAIIFLNLVLITGILIKYYLYRFDFIGLYLILGLILIEGITLMNMVFIGIIVVNLYGFILSIKEMSYIKKITNKLNLDIFFPENRIFTVTAVILASSSILCINHFLKHLLDILGVYATILSIIVSATFVGAQVATDKFSAEISKYYMNDDYVKFYFWLFPLIFISGGILLVLDPNVSDIKIDIHNLSFYPFIDLIFIKYWLIFFLTILTVFLIIFSLILIPNYLKRVMNILGYEKIIIECLNDISNSQSYERDEKEKVNTIDKILNDLYKNEKYDDIKSCLTILSGTEFENIVKNNKMENFDKFIEDYIEIIKEMALKEIHLLKKIKSSSINALKEISISLNSNNLSNLEANNAIEFIVLTYAEKNVNCLSGNKFEKAISSVVGMGFNAFLEITKNNVEGTLENQVKNIENMINLNFSTLSGLMDILIRFYRTQGLAPNNRDIIAMGIDKAFDSISKLTKLFTEHFENANTEYLGLLRILISEYENIVSEIGTDYYNYEINNNYIFKEQFKRFKEPLEDLKNKANAKGNLKERDRINEIIDKINN